MDLDNGDAGGTQSQGGDSGDGKPLYSMPGILHFIQHEWSRFEMERAQWDVERAELQARIAFLQGERKGQENLKRDLIRRIKMLEFALKQERSKVHKLRGGTDVQAEQLMNDANDDARSTEIPTANPNLSWRHGRQLLRQYLQEVGYSDTILDVRSQRVKALLGNNYDITKPVENDNKVVNGDIKDDDQIPNNLRHNEPSENDVSHAFAFLDTTDDDDDIPMQDEDGDYHGDSQRMSRAAKDEFEDSSKFADVNTAIAELDFLNAEPDDADDSKTSDWPIDQNKLNAMKEKFHNDKKQMKKRGMKRPVKKDLQSMLHTLQGADAQKTDDVDIQLPEEDSLPFTVGGSHANEESIENVLGLGELAGLTVANEADPLAYDVAVTKESFRRTWSPKYTLRSHFDGVRAIKFLPGESAVVTASEDHTMKLWNLNKPLPSKKSQALDVEPIYSFRGHIGAVLCLDVDADGAMCFSGGLDATIRCWNIPGISIDAYDTYDSTVTGDVLIGHTDAVWSLSYSNTRQQLISAAADSTIRLWKPSSADPLVQTYNTQDAAAPTCVEFVQCESNHAVASHADGKVVLYDLETGKTPVVLADSGGGRVNAVVTHPTMPLTMTAHEDRHIKFFDNSSGKQIHSMVAHLDSVSSLAVDPNGLYLLSGSHDCSIRLWNLDSKTCIQELTSHRKKFDESIFSVAYHPSATYIASAGADALAKVFV